MLPSGSVRLAVTGTPTRGWVRDSVTTPASSNVGDCDLYGHGAAVAVGIGGHNCYLVYVVRVRISRRLVVWLRLERERTDLC